MSSRTDAFSFGELVLLYPLERGFGLHPDIERLYLTLSLTTAPREERFLLLRTAKLPLI